MIEALKICLTAPPGTGKSTVVKEVVSQLQHLGVPLAGFYTEDVLDQSGKRMGFDLVDVNGGNRAALSRIGFASEVMVDRYGVDLVSLAAFLPLVDARASVVVIDEIGKMQLASPLFCRMIEDLFSRDCVIFSTIHVFEHDLTDRLKARRDVRVVSVNEDNRDNMVRTAVHAFVHHLHKRNTFPF